VVKNLIITHSCHSRMCDSTCSLELSSSLGEGCSALSALLYIWGALIFYGYPTASCASFTPDETSEYSKLHRLIRNTSFPGSIIAPGVEMA
jgi:hypothetical protein